METSGVLSDRHIKLLCDPEVRRLNNLPDGTGTELFIPMINPFVPHQVKTRRIAVRGLDGEAAIGIDGPGREQKIVSYGLSSGGYDVRLDRKFKIFTNAKCQLIDPLNMRDDYYVDHEGDYCIIPPNGYILGLTKEHFVIPRDIIVVAIGKSTYARCGAIVNVTPIEPGWNGKIVIEIANASNVPLKIHADMGIAQFVFHTLTSECDVSYGDRGGKYQGQSSLQTALV